MKLAKLQKRLMFLSPTVQAGWEAESFKSDFEKIKSLGQGAYATVWKARHKKTGVIYAIKQIRKNTLTSESLIDHVRNEVKILYKLNHPNIVKLYNHFEDDFSIYFVLQFAEGGQLFDAVMNSPGKKFEEAKAANYIRQIALALQYIHKEQIIHRDIKPENILIGKNDEAKLADFGWSNFVEGHDKRETYCGTLDYLAPQMVDKEHKHDHRVDIWSLGVLIYQLCTGESPFSSPLFAKNNLTEDEVKKNISTLNYKVPAKLSESCRDLISKILILKPEDRLPIDGILKHPWIKQVTPEETVELVENDNWQQKLKHEFGMIFDIKDEDIQKYGVFSKQEIYSNSRIESIINANKQKIQEMSDKKVKELELKIRELQLKNRRQEEQLKYLRTIQMEHGKCGSELSSLKEQGRQLLRKMQSMAMQMQDYERIIAEYQKSSKR